MLDYVIANTIMMQLGGFQFGINTAAYQSLKRSAEWRWAAQDVFGRDPVLQNVGNGPDTITLEGVVYPEWRGGLGIVDDLRAYGADGVPLLLISGRGDVFGQWVIERVEETQAVFAAAGVARKIEFSLNLRKFSEVI